jgi:hypothetical protein
MNFANRDLGMYIAALNGIAKELGLKSAWLASLQMWGIRVWDIWSYIAVYTKEPITESDHRRLVDETRAEMVPVAELAETLVERYDGWTEADMLPAGEDDEQAVSDKAWNRLLAEKKRELTRLVQEGALAGKRRGRGFLINNGSFYDWLGEPAPLCPDWGKGYDVLPDDQAGEVESLKKARLRAQEAIAASPTSPILEYLEERMGRSVTERKDRWDEAMAALRERLGKTHRGAGRSCGQWRRCSRRWRRSSMARTPSCPWCEKSSTRPARTSPTSTSCWTSWTLRPNSPSPMRSG